MHILITGAAGMIGRKLTARLVEAGELNGRPIEKLTLIDVSAPQRPEKFAGIVGTFAADISEPAVSASGSRRAAGCYFPSRGDRLGRGGARFREGHARQPRRVARAPGSDPPDRRRLLPAARVHLFDRRVRRAVPAGDPGRFSSDAADLLRHAEGDRRASARRIQPPRLPRWRRYQAADHLGAAGTPQQGGLRVLFVDHPRAPCRARKPCCRSRRA